VVEDAQVEPRTEPDHLADGVHRDLFGFVGREARIRRTRGPAQLGAGEQVPSRVQPYRCSRAVTVSRVAARLYASHGASAGPGVGLSLFAPFDFLFFDLVFGGSPGAATSAGIRLGSEPSRPRMCSTAGDPVTHSLPVHTRGQTSRLWCRPGSRSQCPQV